MPLYTVYPKTLADPEKTLKQNRTWSDVQVWPSLYSSLFITKFSCRQTTWNQCPKDQRSSLEGIHSFIILEMNLKFGYYPIEITSNIRRKRKWKRNSMCLALFRYSHTKVLTERASRDAKFSLFNEPFWINISLALFLRNTNFFMFLFFLFLHAPGYR